MERTANDNSDRIMAGIEQIKVEGDEAGMRLDRWFKVHYPGLGFGHLQKLLRSGQVRVDGGRAKSDTRVEPGQTIRVPPLDVDRKSDAPLTARTIRSQDDAEVLARMLLHGRDQACRRHAGGAAKQEGREAAARPSP
jgi:23S rRNA pseudouridine955/2504/2580 synthase